MKRLFVAINLPSEIRDRLTQITTQINADFFSRKLASSSRESAFRWLPPENWHLTLVFLGYQPDEAIEPILKSLRETIKIYSNILKNIRIDFEKIILAPLNRPARMIWLVGSKETSKILGAIKTKLEDKLVKNGVQFKKENRGFNAHLTLARFQSITRTYADLTRTNAEFFREVQRSIPHSSALAFYAKSLDLMESHLHRTGAEYEILASLTFSRK